MRRKLATAACVAVGDELLEGHHPDLDSPVSASALRELGLPTREVHVVGDDEAPLAALLCALAGRRDLVVVTGGLGPTLDDVTRHAAARAAGVELVESPEARALLEEWFARGGRDMPASNLRQALVPAGADVLPNRRGTAPGFVAEVGDALVCCLPGPPAEMGAMLTDALLPWLQDRTELPGSVARAQFHLFGLSESVFAEEVGDWMDRDQCPLMGVSAKEGVLHVRLVATASDPAAARASLEGRADAFRERLGRWVFSEDEPRLEHVVASELLAAGRTVALAESCTAGLVASMLGGVAGVSAVLERAWVTYSDAAKVDELGVDPGLIADRGAVSEEVARAMAASARTRAGTDLALSVTGIAGPGGGTPEKPVGLVWYGLAAGGEVSAHERRFPDVGRNRVRRYAALTALALLRKGLARAGSQAVD